MASDRPFTSEMWESFFARYREYERRLYAYRRDRQRFMKEKWRLIKAGQFDLVSSVDEDIENVDNRIVEVLPMWNTYKGIYDNRHEGAFEVHDLAYRYLEQRRRPLTELHNLLKQNILDTLFTVDLDEFDDQTYRQITNIAFYCMKRNNYITNNPYQDVYGILEDKYNRIKNLGEAVLIMGYKYREVFRSYIRQHLPRESDLALQFDDFMLTGLTTVLSEFYVGEQPALPYLIVVAFTMEVIYYIRESTCAFGLKRQIIKTAVQLLWSLLCGDGFINICGMSRLFWYGSVIYRGHTLAFPDDLFRIHQTRHLAALPWNYFKETPRTDYESRESRMSKWKRYFKARKSARTSAEPYVAPHGSIYKRETVILARICAADRLREFESQTERNAKLMRMYNRMREFEMEEASYVDDPTRVSGVGVPTLLPAISEESIGSGSTDSLPPGEPPGEGQPGCSHWTNE